MTVGPLLSGHGSHMQCKTQSVGAGLFKLHCPFDRSRQLQMDPYVAFMIMLELFLVT